MTTDLRNLYRSLDYTFSNPDLLRRALTHRSRSAENYERLEFLGDSILEFTVSAELYHTHPDLSEGKLTRLRSSLVKKETLAEIARQVGLGDYLQLGSGELKSGGFDRESILADAMEAVFGAVFLDDGIDSAQRVILYLYRDILQAITPKSLEKDPKTRLQEYLQKRSQLLPVYQMHEVEGAQHKQLFVVECIVPGLDMPVRGKGSSRRKAEQQAASKALELLSAR